MFSVVRPEQITSYVSLKPKWQRKNWIDSFPVGYISNPVFFVSWFINPRCSTVRARDFYFINRDFLVGNCGFKFISAFVTMSLNYCIIPFQINCFFRMHAVSACQFPIVEIKGIFRSYLSREHTFRTFNEEFRHV